jgi:hypothetical protein
MRHHTLFFRYFIMFSVQINRLSFFCSNIYQSIETKIVSSEIFYNLTEQVCKRHGKVENIKSLSSKECSRDYDGDRDRPLGSPDGLGSAPRSGSGSAAIALAMTALISKEVFKKGKCQFW